MLAPQPGPGLVGSQTTGPPDEDETFELTCELAWELACDALLDPVAPPLPEAAALLDDVSPVVACPVAAVVLVLVVVGRA
jgi:hypothetical protein